MSAVVPPNEAQIQRALALRLGEAGGPVELSGWQRAFGELSSAG